MLSFIISILPGKYDKLKLIVITYFILANLIISIRINSYEYKVRGFKVTDPVLNEISADLPKNLEKAGLWLETSELNMATYFGSAGHIAPFVSYTKGVIRPNNVVMIPGLHLGARLICEGNLEIPGFFKNTIQKEPFDLDDIYGWRIREDLTVENISDEIRVKLAQASACHKRMINMKVDEGVILNSIVNFDELYEKEKRVMGLNWSFGDNYKKYELNIKLFSSKLLVKEQEFEINSPQESYNTNVFLDRNQKITSLIFSVSSQDKSFTPIVRTLYID